MSMIDNRYQVCCDCCGSVEYVAKKNEAKRRMIAHMGRHQLTENLTFCVYDNMHKSGAMAVYRGRIHGGNWSHGYWDIGREKAAKA